MMKKILTVLIPVYNTEKYIKRCLDSLIDESIIDNIEKNALKAFLKKTYYSFI